jgi:hypothetical protein
MDLPLFYYANETWMETDAAVKSVDDSQSSHELEDLQKGRTDRTWHRFGAGLGGSDAFVSRSFFCLNSFSLFFSIAITVHA